MERFNQRRDPLRLIGKRLFLISLFLLVGVAVSGVGKVYRKERESMSLRAEAERQLEDLSTRRVQLEEDIEKLKTPRGMEEALRERYRLAKSGENLIIIVNPPASLPIETTSSVMEWFQKTLSWW